MMSNRNPELNSCVEEAKSSAGDMKVSSVILLLDMDCFEVQVLQKTEHRDSYAPENPAVVVNHDNIILSVNYAAKRLGVRRTDSLNSAYEKCRMDLQVLKTGTRYGKSDSFLPQTESDEILQCILDYQNDHPSIIVNRASRDEFYFDVTEEVSLRMNQSSGGEPEVLPPSLAVSSLTQEQKGQLDQFYREEPMAVMEGRDARISGSTLRYRILQVYGNPKTTRPYHRDEVRLVFGAIIAREILMEIFQNSGGYIASVGVAHNKLRAKLASDLNKPEGISILTEIGFQRLTRNRFTICHLPGFGGAEGLKFEQALKNYFGCEAVSLTQVQSLSLETLILIYEEAGINLGDAESAVLSLLEKCQGADNSVVTCKVHNDSLSTSATFKHSSNRHEFDQLVHLLCCDMRDRLKYIQRRFNRQAVTVSLKLTFAYSFTPLLKRAVEAVLEFNGISKPEPKAQMKIGSYGLPEVNQMENLISNFILDDLIFFEQVHKIELTANKISSIK